jgi:hypothetical protein
LHLLPAGGWLVLTLKFMGLGRDRTKQVAKLDKYFQVPAPTCRHPSSVMQYCMPKANL